MSETSDRCEAVHFTATRCWLDKGHPQHGGDGSRHGNSGWSWADDDSNMDAVTEYIQPLLHAAEQQARAAAFKEAAEAVREYIRAFIWPDPRHMTLSELAGQIEHMAEASAQEETK